MQRHAATAIFFFCCAGLFAALPKGVTTKPKEPAPAVSLEKPVEEVAEPRVGILPIAAAFVPGVLFHGSGHFVAGNYKAARDLMVSEGVSIILILAVGLPALATGNAAVLVPSVYSFGFIGVSHFFSTWLADIAGVSGLGKITGPIIHPHQRSWVAAGYIKQDDTESDIYGLYRFDGKFATQNFFIRGLFDLEEKRTYQQFGLDTGYRVLRPKWADLYTTFEGRYEMSYEGFSLTSLNALAEFALYLENLTPYFSKTMRGITFFTTVGAGRQYIHLRSPPNFKSDVYFANLILMHGMRFRVTRFTELSSAFNFRKDNILGGATIIGGTFVHQLEVFAGNFFTRVTFEHGRGYRLFMLAGVNW